MIQRLLNIPEKQHFFLFGARQTGKTTLVKEILSKKEGRGYYISLAEEDQYFKFLKDPARLRYELEPRLKSAALDEVCLDEIQRVPALLNEVQGLIDRFNARFILTGSSARKLKRGGANLLGGRAVSRELYPLSFVELGESFSLEQALRFGSLPRIWSSANERDRIDLLTGYATLYLREEIQTEGLVRNLAGFTKFLDVAAQHSGELLNYKAIGDDVGIPGRSVQTYFEILEDTLIAFRLPPFERSVRRRLRKHDKVYLFDIGVLNALQQTLASPDAPVLRGRRFEHFIVLEAKRMLHYLQVEHSLCFWRTKDDEEVDLLFLRGGDPILACEIKSSSHITPMALKGLKAFHSEHPSVERVVVAPVATSFEIDGIAILSIPDFFERLKHI